MGKKQKNADGQPKQQKPTQPKPVELLFHESLGKELTQKFSEITTNPVRRPSVATYFATGIIEEQSQGIATITTRVEKTVVVATEAAADAPTEKAGPTPFVAEVKEAITLPVRDDQPQVEKESVPVEKKRATGKTYSLGDMNAFQSIEALVARHGRMTHMGVRDHNYDFFLNRSKSGVISYRLVDDKVAVISGDPVCPVSQYSPLLEEFATFCKDNRWQWAMQGGSKEMAGIAKQNEWTTVHYGTERALNVQTNPVLLGSEGKRIRTQCKQLQKTVSIGIYCPAYTRDAHLEQQIVDMYDNWRMSRNTSRTVQAYVTVFDMLSMHRLMIFVYTLDPAGKLLGFAALRRLQEGYHIDPITVDPDAPRGMTDLLLISSMALLKESNISRLVLGVEPLDELGEISGMSKALETLTRKSHKLISAELPLGGKKGFNDRFRPDEAFEEKLFMIYPNSPSIKQSVAMAHFANIHLHDAVKQRIAKEREKRRRNSDPELKTTMPTEGTAPANSEQATGRPVPSRTGSDTVTRQISAGSDPMDQRLSPPSRRERASSRIRLFRQNLDQARSDHTPSDENHHQRKSEDLGLLQAPERQRERSNSRSRIRLFKRNGSEAPDRSDDRGDGAPLTQRHSEDSGLLAPPQHRERASSRSRSPARIPFFRRRTSDPDVKAIPRDGEAYPMPLVS